MKLIRRVAATLAMAVIAAVGVRLGGKGGTPRQHGGWKPVDLDDFDLETMVAFPSSAEAFDTRDVSEAEPSVADVAVAVVVTG